MKPRLRQHHDLVKACSKILAGASPEVQGSMTAELMAVYVAGHTHLKCASLQMEVAVIRDLLPGCVAEIHGSDDTG